MTVHGLAEMTLGVPNVDATRQFYREFGLAESANGMFASADGGDQLRIHSAAVAHDIAVTDHDDVPSAFVHPSDVEEMAAALQGVS